MPKGWVIPLALLLVLGCIQPSLAEGKRKPFFRADLKPFGYVQYAAEYSTLVFLSDDLLLLTVNQRLAHGVDPLTTDKPPSTMVVFELNKREVLRRGSMLVMKSPRSVAVLKDGNFLVASASDVKLCSAELLCDKSFVTRAGAPIDADSLRLLQGMDNRALRVEDTSDDGSRTVSCELSSTIWNKLLHPIPFDEPSPDDRLSVIVYETASRKALMSFRYNPKMHYVGPAISPRGTKLALVRDGGLEVYELPQ